MPANLQVRLGLGVLVSQAGLPKAVVKQPPCLLILLGAEEGIGAVFLAERQPVARVEPRFREGGFRMSLGQVLP